MQLRKPTQKPIVLAADNGKVKIVHHQTVRQSANYNSAETSYGVEMFVADTETEIKNGIQKAEQIVESALSDKFLQQRKLLQGLAK
jgi:hypothetical protein